MSFQKFQVYFFLIIMLVSMGLTLTVFSPYLTLLAFGGVLAVVFRPIYRHLLAWFKSETAAAFLTVIGVMITILLPAIYLFAALSTEIVEVFSNVKGVVRNGEMAAIVNRMVPSAFHDQVPAMIAELGNALRALAGVISTNLVGILRNAVGIVFGFLIIMISVYYLLKDGSKIKRELMTLSPLRDQYDELVIQKVIVAVGAVMGGILIVGLVKGVLAAVLFLIFGVPAPFFWGAMTTLAAFLPFVGSSLVTVPVVLYLLAIGRIGAAIGVGLIAIGLIGTIDNLIGPKFIQGKTHIHPLLVLLSILGGISFYGFSGFILGPLTLAVTMALLDIYKKEFRNYLEKAE
ncbi:MAG: AI-2E family transporter [Patescibacteria group bacterium]